MIGSDQTQILWVRYKYKIYWACGPWLVRGGACGNHGQPFPAVVPPAALPAPPSSAPLRHITDATTLRPRKPQTLAVRGGLSCAVRQKKRDTGQCAATSPLSLTSGHALLQADQARLTSCRNNLLVSGRPCGPPPQFSCPEPRVGAQNLGQLDTPMARHASAAHWRPPSQAPACSSAAFWRSRSAFLRPSICMHTPWQLALQHAKCEPASFWYNASSATLRLCSMTDIGSFQEQDNGKVPHLLP